MTQTEIENEVTDERHQHLTGALQDLQYARLLEVIQEYSKKRPRAFAQITMAFLDRLKQDDPAQYYESIAPFFLDLLEQTNLFGTIDSITRTLDVGPVGEDDLWSAVEKALKIAHKANMWMIELKTQKRKQ